MQRAQFLLPRAPFFVAGNFATLLCLKDCHGLQKNHYVIVLFLFWALSFISSIQSHPWGLHVVAQQSPNAEHSNIKNQKQQIWFGFDCVHVFINCFWTCVQQGYTTVPNPGSPTK